MTQRYESETVDPAPLGKPLKFEFSGLTAQNRFLKAAMTERISSWDPKNHDARGIPSKNLINVYKRWGEGQYGVILSGNTMIHPIQLEAQGNPIIPLDTPFSGERFEAFKELGAAAKAHGSLMIGQLSHPGRQVSEQVNDHPISASDVQLEGNPLGMTFAKPREATQEDLNEVIDGFAHAAEFLYKAGWDGIQIHGAHGYLFAQFLSKTTNKRTDKYGGPLENRYRLILEVAQAIRKRVPETFSVSIKINSVEFQDGGFTPEEAKQLCEALESNKFDFVELSGGTYQNLLFSHKRESTKKREAFFLDFAEQIVPGLKKTKTYVTGGLKTAGAMVEAVKTVDGVGLGRPATQEFDIPNAILKGRILGGIKTKLDEQNFPLTNVAAGTQIRQVGKDQEPIDLSRKEHVDVFQNSMGNWSEKMANDTDGYMFGYVDLENFTPNPYGRPYTEAKT